MEEIKVFKTFDNKLHITDKHASTHLEKLYADILCPLANNLCILTYVETCDYIDKNLNKFISLHEIKQDMEKI